jgi:hypothetical protein
MKKNKLIVEQILAIKKLEKTVLSLKAVIDAAEMQIVCVGGPLNDNVRQYNKEQMQEWGRVLKILKTI